MTEIYNEAILLKYGEIALKGLNRFKFEDMLRQNIKKALEGCGNYRIEREQSAMMIFPLEDNADMIFRNVQNVFGIVSISRAMITEKEIGAIEKCVERIFVAQIKKFNSFKADAKRSDKSFPMNSVEISQHIGNLVYEMCGDIKVDLRNPEVILTVEIRDNGAFVHCGKVRGAGGMPIGSNGKGLILLSGGIDSPVAAYMMARRGMTVEALHFSSEPYTSQNAKEKVMRLVKKLTDFTYSMKFINISLTEIQEEIKSKCNYDYFTLLLRRFMMEISERTAKINNCSCLITGESLGQVASQTIEAISVTDSAVSIPVFRPCIGLDKYQIVETAQKIDTFDVSIEPFEDCCTVFTPKHPVTKPKLVQVLEEESKLDREALINRAMETVNEIIIKRGSSI